MWRFFTSVNKNTANYVAWQWAFGGKKPKIKSTLSFKHFIYFISQTIVFTLFINSLKNLMKGKCNLLNYCLNKHSIEQKWKSSFKIFVVCCEHLRADNFRLQQEQSQTSSPGLRSDPPNMPGPSRCPSISNDSCDTLAERFVFIPRDRRCPKFNGVSGVRIIEWVEEVQTCMRARRLSVSDQAFFMFDHLEGEARKKFDIDQLVSVMILRV